MRTSETLSKIAPALTKALAEMVNPPKTKKVTVKGKTKSGQPYSYDYFYAALPEIMDAIRPILGKHGLAVMQSTETQDGFPSIVTKVLHESGEWISSDHLIMAPSQNDPQSAGSAITYGRRYSLTALLGLAADEDDDGQAGSQKRSDSTPQGGSQGRQAPPSGSKGGAGISEKQRKCIFAKAKAGYPDTKAFDDYMRWLKGNYNVEHLEELTKQQAGEIIDQLTEGAKS